MLVLDMMSTDNEDEQDYDELINDFSFNTRPTQIILNASSYKLQQLMMKRTF